MCRQRFGPSTCAGMCVTETSTLCLEFTRFSTTEHEYSGADSLSVVGERVKGTLFSFRTFRNWQRQTSLSQQIAQLSWPLDFGVFQYPQALAPSTARRLLLSTSVNVVIQLCSRQLSRCVS